MNIPLSRSWPVFFNVDLGNFGISKQEAGHTKEHVKPNIYCRFTNHSNVSEIIELPEDQLRKNFPLIAKYALESDFKKSGTQETPLDLAVSRETYQLIQKYLETYPLENVFHLCGEDAAEILNQLPYAGHYDLFDQFKKQITGSIKNDLKTFSDTKVIWYGNLYVNAQDFQIRIQLEDYFSQMLSKLVLGSKRQLTPRGENFTTLDAQKMGEEQSPRRKKPCLDSLPRPDSFDWMMDLYRQIELSSLSINLNAPQWFWEGVKTIESLSEIYFKVNKNFLNHHCQKALKEMPQRPKLILKVPKEYEKYKQEEFPEGFDLFKFYENC